MELKDREYRCKNCGHVQFIQTNHTQNVIDYCGRGPDGVASGGSKGCSWKPSFGKAEYAIAHNGQTFRPFECVTYPYAQGVRRTDRCTFVKTREFRNPRAGEFYLSGAIPEAYDAKADLSTEYFILEKVPA